MLLRVVGSLPAAGFWALALAGTVLLSAQEPARQSPPPPSPAVSALANHEAAGSIPIATVNSVEVLRAQKRGADPSAGKNPFARVFSVQAIPAQKQGAETEKAVVLLQGSIAITQHHADRQLKCHVTQFKVNPDVDPKIHVQIPEKALNARIRVIEPPPCHRN